MIYVLSYFYRLYSFNLENKSHKKCALLKIKTRSRLTAQEGHFVIKKP